MSNALPGFKSPPHSFDSNAAPQSSEQRLTAAPYLVPNSHGSESGDLAIAVIGPDPDRRAAAVRAFSEQPGNLVRQFSTFSSGSNDLAQMVNEQYHVALIDLDGDSNYALELVKRIGAPGRATVMAYSANASPDLLVRCMRAGAREFLEAPFSRGEIFEALARVANRQPGAVTRKDGKLLVFLGTKGGVGVTSVACNFAVALAQQPERKTLLIDLDLPLGDAALNLGIISEYSTVNALEAAERLDGAFLSRLVMEHSSGLCVLQAPGKFPYSEPSGEAVEKLLMVARQQFDNVVVDLGSRINSGGTAPYEQASAIYLVTQAGVPELRNANRLISQVFSQMPSQGSGRAGPKLEIVLNRCEKSLNIREEHVTQALTRPAQWKIPNDHALLRKMQLNATPVVLGDSAVARMIREMANAVNPQPEGEPKAKGKKKGFSLFG